MTTLDEKTSSTGNGGPLVSEPAEYLEDAGIASPPDVVYPSPFRSLGFYGVLVVCLNFITILCRALTICH